MWRQGYNQLTQPWAQSLWPLIWKISFFLSLSGRRIRSSSHSHGEGGTTRFQSCLGVTLTILPSIITVWRDMDHAGSLQDITLVCSLCWCIMLIGPDEQGRESTFRSVLRQTRSKRFKRDPTKNRGVATSVKSLGFCGLWHVLCMFQNKWEIPTSYPSPLQESSRMLGVGGPFRFWRQNV